jgi:exo-beta-1,3-glucanase (GH17 family)
MFGGRLGSRRFAASLAMASIAPFALAFSACGGPAAVRQSQSATRRTSSGSNTEGGAAAKHTLYGLDFTPWLPGQVPNRTDVTASQVEARMQMVAPYVKWIRTYGCQDGLAQAGAIAHQLGLKIAMGATLTKNGTSNEQQISCLIQAAENHQADILIVGNETISSGTLTIRQLISYIDQVRASAGGIPVTTAEPYNIWLSRRRLINAVDVIFANFYPFLHRVPVAQGVRTLASWYGQVVSASEGKQVWISETGWPSSGGASHTSATSSQDASRYLEDVRVWAAAHQVPYLYFTAFDEPWRRSATKPWVQYYGVFNQSGRLKPDNGLALVSKAAPDRA